MINGKPFKHVIVLLAVEAPGVGLPILPWFVERYAPDLDQNIALP